MRYRHLKRSAPPITGGTLRRVERARPTKAGQDGGAGVGWHGIRQRCGGDCNGSAGAMGWVLTELVALAACRARTASSHGAPGHRGRARLRRRGAGVADAACRHLAGGLSVPTGRGRLERLDGIAKGTAVGSGRPTCSNRQLPTCQLPTASIPVARRPVARADPIAIARQRSYLTPRNRGVGRFHATRRGTPHGIPDRPDGLPHGFMIGSGLAASPAAALLEGQA